MSGANSKERQLPTYEEAVVLRTIASSVARRHCRYLEIGSWCGDSAVILGKSAQENEGRLYCVDWWKGNVGTELAEIAERRDVFSLFWRRMCDEGLEDFLVPIRGRSDDAVSVMRDNYFDLIFIDGDHRYDQALKDIKACRSLVKRDGIICGHDCEGRITDFDEEFLARGRDLDYFETVHCGVVLAVGSLFPKYSINHSIWSARARTEDGDWEETNLSLGEIGQSRQSAPPLLAHTKNFNILRYGRLVYGVPRTLGRYDIRDEATRGDCEILKAPTLDKLLELIQEPLWSEPPPFLVESYRGFNLVNYNQQIIGLSEALGNLDVQGLDASALANYQSSNKAVIAASTEDAKLNVDFILSRRSVLVKGLDWGKGKLKSALQKSSVSS